MKKTSLWFIILAASLLICSCADKNTDMTLSGDMNSSTSVSSEIDSSAAVQTVSEDTSVPDDEVNTEQLSEPLQFIKNLRVGWNLGNTFEAYSAKNAKDELSYETMWCGQKTTKEMFEVLKDAGFKTIRIPVSWHNHVSGDDFTISDVWMKRVHEVVDYAYDLGFYVIINIHHDCEEGYYYPSYKQLAGSLHYVECIWSQIAEEFKDYDERMIFECINEPRLTGTVHEWNFNNGVECTGSANCINQLNQKFVDTVRASEGYNATRYLMVPGYDASADGALSKLFALPSDTVADRLIVSVHAYTPYNFALQDPKQKGSINTFDPEKEGKEIDKFMKRLNDKFVSNNIPVLIGEFGARNKDNNTEARTAFAGYYVAKARSYNMSCLWWDNNSFVSDGEDFGLLRRIVKKFLFADIVQAIMDNCE